MYHPTSRVLAVLELLRAHERMTGAEMARRLEVDARTLRRYVTTLQDLGIPILAERGRNGAYSLAPTYRLPPMTFTNEEALALEVGLLAAAQLGLDESAPAIESARAKLEGGMTTELKARARALADIVRVALDSAPASASGEVMLVMSSAAQLRQRVHLRYRSERRGVTERDFDPYGIAHRWGKWYVVGWCHLRQSLRTFRLDRVTQVESTGATFERVETVDPVAYIERAIATLPRRFPFEVILKTDLVTAQREMTEILGLLALCEGGVLLRGSVDDLDWLARQLMSFSFDFAIREPDALREAIRRRVHMLRGLVDDPFVHLS